MKRTAKRGQGGTPKYILNPEYVGSPEWEAEREELKAGMVITRDCPEDYFPEDYGKKLPEDGAWIMLLMSVHVGRLVAEGKTERITVPHLSTWYALPTLSQAAVYRGIRASKAVIQTPQGEVHIWPHEYTVVTDLSKYLDMTEEEGFYIHFMSETVGFDADKLLYIQSRGIPKGVAQRLLLPELKDPHFCYFTFHPAYSEMFGEGFGTPYLTAANHRRRAAARRAKGRARVPQSTSA